MCLPYNRINVHCEKEDRSKVNHRRARQRVVRKGERERERERERKGMRYNVSVLNEYQSSCCKKAKEMLEEQET